MVKGGLAFGGILAILSGVVTYNNIYATTEGTTKFSVDVNNAVLELTVPSSPAVIDLSPTMTNASFGSTSINVHVATNNITGYTLTMTPTNNTEATSLIRTELLPNEQSYRTIPTLALTDPTSTGYTEQSFTTNKWGYKITGDNYYGIDPNNTTVSHPAWITNAPTNETTHNLTLAAKVNAETTSGAYETTLNFSAVTNAVPKVDIVSFDGNGADSGDMSGESITVVSGSFTTLPANTFAKSNYRFIGWNTNANGTGISYVDEGEYTSNATNQDRNITLYAMWSSLPSGASTTGTTPNGNPGVTISRAYEIAYTAAHKGMWEKDTEGNGYTQVSDGVYHNRDVRWDMQGMTSEICDSVTAIHDIYGALDTRDWHIYNITKTLDGRCWMQENLALDPVSSSEIKSRMFGNTNASDAAITSFNNSVQYEGGNSYTNYPRIQTTYVDVVAQGTDDPLANTAWTQGWKSGVFYNFCAASAGAYCYSEGYGVDSNPASAIDIDYDLCPTGWRMPTGGPLPADGGQANGGEYQAFYNYYPNYINFRTALRIPLAGYWSWGSLYQQGISFSVWSSTFYDSNFMYYLTGWSTAEESLVEPQYSNHRSTGRSVRCINKIN